MAHDYAVSFGGNAVTAAFACAKLGFVPDLIATVADDWLGRMFLDMARTYAIPVHPRSVARSSLSFVLPNDGKRAIIRARDDKFLHPFPDLDLDRLPRPCISTAIRAMRRCIMPKLCRARGILTSLDGGGLRGNLDALLSYDRCRHRRRTALRADETFAAADARISQGQGLQDRRRHARRARPLWYDESGDVSRLPALPVPQDKIIDTSGAGDVFHGAYIASYLAEPDKDFAEHFRFARAAAAYKITHLGNEAGLPTQADVAAIRREYNG